MSAALRWRIAAAFVAVFIAGVATGVFGGALHWRHMFRIMHGDHLKGRLHEHLQHELKLTPEQMLKVGPIADEMASQLDSIRDDTSRRVAETMQQSHDKILPFLTPDQKKRLDEMRQRHRHMLHAPGAPPPPEP